MQAIDVIRAAESALAEAQMNCAGNDATEGENADTETIFFNALKACREYIAAYESPKEITITQFGDLD